MRIATLFTADSTKGFAIGSQGKGWGITYLKITPDNIFAGEYAGSKSEGGVGNVAIGNHAGETLTSSNNVMIGNWAGTNNSTGTGNVFLGPNAGRNSVGDNNVFIGKDAGKDEDGDNVLFIDNTSSSSPLIFGDFSTNEVQMNGDMNVVGSVSYTGTLISASDQLFKKDVSNIEPVISDLMKIKTRTYTMESTQTTKSTSSQEETHFGFVAQELEEVFPELVVDVTYPNGFSIENQDEGPIESFKGVKYLEMIPVLLKGIQEQQQEIEMLKQRIVELEAE